MIVSVFVMENHLLRKVQRRVKILETVTERNWNNSSTRRNKHEQLY